MARATKRGERQAEKILDAAYLCLARYGYSGTSMQRIADTAGVNKRMLHYYFENRERLFDAVARRVGDRVLEQVRKTVTGLETPADVVSLGFDRLWDLVTGDPQLQAVYFGLAAESTTDPVLKETLSHINDGYRELVRSLIRGARERGYGLRWDEDSLIVLMIAVVQGLTLHFLEQGETRELRRAIDDFKHWLTGVAAPAH